MAFNDDFDPTRVLDGFRVTPRHAEDEDPTRLLDGWQPGGPLRRQVDAEDARIVSELPATGPLPPAGGASPLLDWPDTAALPTAAEAIDLHDIGAEAQLRAATYDDIEDIDADWQPTLPTLPPEPLLPGVLKAWKPGAWIGAVRRVSGATAEVIDTPQGPVVENFPPNLLLALWPPQPLASPFLGRWPMSVQLSAVEPERAGALLLQRMPDGAELWLSEHEELDWATLGELVLLHEPSLRGFQFKALRGFVDTQREEAFKRLNDDYRLPDGGIAIERKPGA